MALPAVQNILPVARDVDIEHLSAIRQDWRDIKLGVLDPVDVNDIPMQTWRAIEMAWREPLNPSLRCSMPVAVAHFKPAIEEIMVRWMHRQRRKREVRILAEIPLLVDRKGQLAFNDHEQEIFARAFEVDATKIHRRLFGAQIERASADGGFFKDSLAPHLHMDGLNENGIRYLARVNALPFEMINGGRIFNMTNDVAGVVLKARSKDSDEKEDAEAARQMLRDWGYLKPTPLGEVVMTFAPQFMKKYKDKPYPPTLGTLHCSTPLPPNGAYSILFQASGYFRPQP